MNVSLAWLQRYFEEPLPSMDAVAEALTFHAFEVEDVVGDVMDVKVLPDRAAYGLSHRGIALELSAALDRPLKRDPLREPIPEWPSTDELAISIDTEKSARQMGALVKGVKVGPSPAWLREALEAVGQRSVNNVVDATNYVTLDMGQPLHAFDAGKIARTDGVLAISVRDAAEGEPITTLSGDQYALPEGTAVIAEAGGAALDIAGVKGGLASGIDESTTDLYVSVANFDAASIRKTAQSLKLWTDASQRFQNDLSPALAAYGMREVLALIQAVAGGELIGVVDVKRPEADEVSPSVSVTLARIRSVLGTDLSEDEVARALTRLGLTHTLADGTFTVMPPFERRDLTLPEDLIEEVGRTIGYDAIPSVPLPPLPQAPDQSRFYGLERVRDFFVERGYTEVSTQSFDAAGEVKLANPLQQDRPWLRASLLGTLEDALARATLVAPRTVGPEKLLKLFEVGSVFTKDGEFTLVALGVNVLDGKKAQAAEILKENVATFEQELLGSPSSARYSLAGDRVELNLSNVDIAALGAVDGVPYAPVQEPLGAFRPYSIYPFMLRDIAVWTPEGTQESQVSSLILAELDASGLLARMDLFDRFEKDGRTSYAFRLVFEAMDRTLSDTDIDPLMERVTKALNAAPGFEVR